MSKPIPLLLCTIILCICAYLGASSSFFLRIITHDSATEITGIDWYEPKAWLEGNPNLDPIPAQETPNHFKPALNAAISYLESRNSFAFLVMHRGQIVIEKYFHGRGPDDLFNGMSMTKAIIGLLIGQALQEKNIPSLDEPAGKLFQEWSRDERYQITIRNLLQMMSGLRNDKSTSNPLSDFLQMHLQSDIPSTLLSIPATRPPAEEYDHSNFNTQVLALILQRLYQKPLQSLVQEKIWQHIGKDKAFFWLDRPNGNAHAYCCFFATPRDWLSLGQTLMNQGQTPTGNAIAPQAWVDFMRTPGPKNPAFGAHLWLYSRAPQSDKRDDFKENVVAEDMFELDGRHAQRIYVIPSRELVIVRLGQKPHEWDDAFLPNLFIKAVDALSKAPPGSPKKTAKSELN